jgi:hypothetical protein
MVATSQAIERTSRTRKLQTLRNEKQDATETAGRRRKSKILRSGKMTVDLLVEFPLPLKKSENSKQEADGALQPQYCSGFSSKCQV